MAEKLVGMYSGEDLDAEKIVSDMEKATIAAHDEAMAKKGFRKVAEIRPGMTKEERDAELDKVVYAQMASSLRRHGRPDLAEKAERGELSEKDFPAKK